MSSSKSFLHGFLSFSLLLAPMFAADTQAPAKKVVARVDGAEVTEEDLGVQAQIIQVKRQEYELKLRSLEIFLSRKAVEKAAAAKSLSVEEFYQQEVDSKIPEPPTSEVQGFYFGQREKYQEPLDKVWDQVSQALKRVKIQDGRQALAKKLRQTVSVQILMQPPKWPVEVGKAPRRGTAAAPVTIVEFADYQCPYCRRIQPVLKQLAAKYGDKLSFVFKDFPLNIHPQAQPAAEAARCAGEQGKYWEYHDALFSAPALNSEALAEAARRIELDAQGFQACTAAGKYKSVVQSDFAEGQHLGVVGTPAFFINGIFLNGAQPISAFETVIEAELASAKNKEVAALSR